MPLFLKFLNSQPHAQPRSTLIREDDCLFIPFLSRSTLIFEILRLLRRIRD
jgi:hypothetical protein